MSPKQTAVNIRVDGRSAFPLAPMTVENVPHVPAQSKGSGGLAKLAAAFAANGPECEEIQEAIVGYTAAEKAGQPVHRHHPALWLHIRHCPACGELHDRIMRRS